MPELPEVYGYQQIINSTCLKKTITSFECRDKRLLKKPMSDFSKHLVGNKFTETKRIGKYLFLRTSGAKILLMHFGMTGRPNYYKDAEQRPKYGHIVLTFDDGFHFAFENKRKFGRWDLLDDIEDYRKEHKLSKDARELSLNEFMKSIKNRKVNAKKILMDQSVAAGIGNWMADDILYQSKIHPETNITDLSNKELETIFEKMQHVIEVAIKFDAHYPDFPDYFFIHNRSLDGKCHHTGGNIEKLKVGGRTTYYSPKLQSLK